MTLWQLIPGYWRMGCGNYGTRYRRIPWWERLMGISSRPYDYGLREEIKGLLRGLRTQGKEGRDGT